MRKKIISSVLMVALLLSLCACGEKSDGESDTLHLALRDGVYAEVIEQCLVAFEEEYGIKCEVEKLSEEDLYNAVADDAKNDEGKYDLCMVDGSWMAEFAGDGYLADLSELGYSLDDDIIPATTKISYYDEKLYLAPYYGNVTVLLFNKSLVKGAGFSGDTIESLDDVKKIARYAKSTGVSGFIYRGDTPNNLVVDFLPILLTYGGWVVDEDNNPTVNSIAFHDALNSYIELIGTGEALEKENMISAIANNTGALGIAWPGWYTPDENSSADYCALSGRVNDQSTAYNANVYGVWTIGIPSNSTNKEMAAKLLTHLMDPDVQKSTVKDGGVPCRYSSLADSEILAEFPQYNAVRNALESGTYRPIMKEWSQFYTILGEEMDMILKGEVSVDEGLLSAQGRLEELMAESK